jgi:dipeptidyl aminopeptidase/acylaminoacyl peptidase
LRDALTQAGVPNELVTIPKGGHGSFSDDQTSAAFSKIWDFLAAHNLRGLTNIPSPEGH